MKTMTKIISAYDLPHPDDPTRTVKEVNAELTHNIPIGALVEVVANHECNGIRCFVVHHGRDCDQSPLYWLSPEPDDKVFGDEDTNVWSKMRHKWTGGWGENSLKVVRLPDSAEERSDSEPHL